ncbi:unnamed protein product [Lactuca virosa]|uniref:Helicase ATP-binding domain-containing protein n=1 Tax=Lactuca virosa TaxID=75947 RepID=A0AAU9MPQ2_9ASTR|nr:unnamed protein product [Lactuca virosa]
MGLGKTLQALAIMASDFVERRTSNNNEDPPSLIICPSTLVGHWMFWNYCVLDEGHIIKNAKSKITCVVKQLKAQHRLILIGTPIQNNVLELWSFFDFLMPGFLGTERQFQATYGKPLAATRDSKCSAKDAEAGVHAMEALHKQLTEYIKEQLRLRNLHVSSLYTVHSLKENLCYVAFDYESELKKDNTKASYKVASEGFFTLEKERFQTGEILFQPHIAGLINTMGLHQVVADCIERCHAAKMRTDHTWFRTVVLAGGTACLPGLPERLEKEVHDLLPPSISNGIRVITSPYGADSAWYGAKLLSNLSTFPNSWCITEETQSKSKRSLICDVQSLPQQLSINWYPTWEKEKESNNSGIVTPRKRLSIIVHLLSTLGESGSLASLQKDLGQFSAIYESCFPVVTKEWEKLEIVGVGVATYESGLLLFVLTTFLLVLTYLL